jgi:hypothetical protein
MKYTECERRRREKKRNDAELIEYVMQSRKQKMVMKAVEKNEAHENTTAY